MHPFVRTSNVSAFSLEDVLDARDTSVHLANLHPLHSCMPELGGQLQTGCGRSFREGERRGRRNRPFDLGRGV